MTIVDWELVAHELNVEIERLKDQVRVMESNGIAEVEAENVMLRQALAFVLYEYDKFHDEDEYCNEASDAARQALNEQEQA